MKTILAYTVMLVLGFAVGLGVGAFGIHGYGSQRSQMMMASVTPHTPGAADSKDYVLISPEEAAERFGICVSSEDRKLIICPVKGKPDVFWRSHPGAYPLSRQ